MELTVLASGSQGNCSALVVPHAGDGDQPGRLVFIDAGLSPKATKERLYTAIRRMPDEATDLLLTHLDADHWRHTWQRTLDRHPIRVRVHRAHAREALRLGVPAANLCPFDDTCDLGDGLVVHACRTPHDDRGSTAYCIEQRCQRGVTRLGFATDLGRVLAPLLEHFRDLDCLAIESNYDPVMEENSTRPASLKDRIMGGKGHLSNDESITAAMLIAATSTLQAIVLLHLSQQCNCPRVVAQLWNERAPHLCERVIVAEQFRPTRTLRVEPRPRAARVVFCASLFDGAEGSHGSSASPSELHWSTTGMTERVPNA
ncbi:MAG: MBL fold metallo-hydrolase [Phycisphaerae bacterium]|nr:MBL fold metallo-hydrolase [Phycisphaerae bacterium]